MEEVLRNVFIEVFTWSAYLLATLAWVAGFAEIGIRLTEIIVSRLCDAKEIFLAYRIVLERRKQGETNER